MDLTQSIVPKSDQLNAEDLLAGPITVTIKDVTAGSPEQPFNINLVERPGRPYRPSKSMRRILVVAWGAEASEYAGRQLTLVRNPDIMFGGVKVGGIEIRAMSNLDKPLTIALTVTRGKRRDFTVQPLKGATPTPSATPADPILVDEWLSAINEAGTLAQLEAAWHGAAAAGVTRDPRIVAAKDKRKADLNAA